MAVIARNQITLSWQLDIKQTIYYYKKQSSTSAVPAKPTAYPPSGWTTTEPTYSSGETSTLYVTVCTIYSNNSYEYSDVSVSASFEAAKAAYNKAAAAEGVANNAITAANGKNKIFYQNTAPTSGMSEGDLWFDTDGGNAVYEYKKTSSSPETYEWTLRQFGSGSIAAGSITTNEINVANLSSIKANLGEITAGVLRSNTYTEASASSTYSTSGMKIDLNTMRIKTPKFAVTPSGVLYAKDADIAGNITADTGKIGGWDINSEQIRSDVTSGTTKYSAIQQSMNSSAITSRFAFAVVEYANGSTTYTDIPFRVNYDGSLLSTKGTIGGWTIGSSRLESTKTISGTIYDSYIQNMDGTDLTRGAFVLRNSTDGGTTWNYPFLVRYNGEGRIGAWNFNANAFYWGGGWKSTSTAGAYLGINGLSVTGKDFYLIGTGTTSSTLYFGIGSTTEAAYISLESGALCIGGDYISSIDIFKSLNVYGTVRLQATSHDIGLSVATSGNAGIYDYANSGWLVYASTDGVATLGNSTYGVFTYSWADSGHPIVSNGTANHRVSQFYMSSATSLRVNAQGNASAYAFYYITTSSSDIRLKENIKDTETEALPIIDKIKIRQFDWKDGVHQDIGMIADEIEQLDDRLTVGGGRDEEGRMNVKTIDTFYLTGYLIKAVQELSARIKKLERRAS